MKGDDVQVHVVGKDAFNKLASYIRVPDTDEAPDEMFDDAPPEQLNDAPGGTASSSDEELDDAPGATASLSDVEFEDAKDTDEPPDEEFDDQWRPSDMFGGDGDDGDVESVSTDEVVANDPTFYLLSQMFMREAPTGLENVADVLGGIRDALGGIRDALDRLTPPSPSPFGNSATQTAGTGYSGDTGNSGDAGYNSEAGSDGDDTLEWDGGVGLQDSDGSDASDGGVGRLAPQDGGAGGIAPQDGGVGGAPPKEDQLRRVRVRTK